MEEILDLLERLHDYMDNKADVIDGDYGVPEPNKEMIFEVELRHAIKSLEATMEPG